MSRDADDIQTAKLGRSEIMTVKRAEELKKALPTAPQGFEYQLALAVESIGALWRLVEHAEKRLSPCPADLIGVIEKLREDYDYQVKSTMDEPMVRIPIAKRDAADEILTALRVVEIEL